MQNLKIPKGGLPSRVHVPASKSYANRALVLGAVTPGDVTLENVPEATDVLHLVEALEKIGLSMDRRGSTLVMKGSFPASETEGKGIDIGEGGTTARFLAALLLLGKKEYTLKLGKRLKDRPWEEFLQIAQKLGGKVELDGDRLKIQGPIKKPQSLEVDCSRTTQFATAFDLVLSGTEILPRNVNSSEAYLAMNAPLKEHFQTELKYVVPRDWSSSAFPMVFGALNQNIDFPGLFFDPFQADSRILEVLNDLGAVETHPGGLLVRPLTRPQSVQLSMNDCLDLFPAMVFLLAHIPGNHVLQGLENLAYKESDRLKEMEKILKTFGRKFTAASDELRLEGSQELHPPVTLNLPDDHRIVMAAALFLRHHEGGELNQANSVTKSYPGFFELLR